MSLTALRRVAEVAHSTCATRNQFEMFKTRSHACSNLRTFSAVRQKKQIKKWSLSVMEISFACRKLPACSLDRDSPLPKIYKLQDAPSHGSTERSCAPGCHKANPSHDGKQLQRSFTRNDQWGPDPAKQRPSGSPNF